MAKPPEGIARLLALAGAYTPEVQEAQRLKASLAEFVKAAWREVEGARALKWNWHLTCLCDHMQALFEGRLGTNKIIFNVPPRTSKSTVVSIMFPAWAWTKKPWMQFMFASHKLELARDFAYKRRALLESAWYKNLFGEDVVLRQDRNNIVEIGTEENGVMYTTTAGASSTGRGADCLVSDDPNSAEEMESELERASKLRWVDVTWATRANDPVNTLQVVIQQRTHVDDISGHLLREGGWLHVKIPMEFNPDKRCVTPIWSDPRATRGELLDAERFPKSYVDERRKSLGPYFFASQYDQEPFPLGGGVFKEAWFGRWSASAEQPGHIMAGMYTLDPMRAFRFAVVDPAITEATSGEKKTSDPDYFALWACAAISTPEGALLVALDAMHERIEAPDIVPRLVALHRHWRFAVIGVETVAFQLSLFQYARRAGLPVREISTKNDPEAIYRIDRDKMARAVGATPLVSSRRCFIPAYAPWVGDFLAEACAFPNAPHDDWVDVLSMAVAVAEKFKDAPGRRPQEEPAIITDDERMANERRRQDEPRDPMERFYGVRPSKL